LGEKQAKSQNLACWANEIKFTILDNNWTKIRNLDKILDKIVILDKRKWHSGRHICCLPIYIGCNVLRPVISDNDDDDDDDDDDICDLFLTMQVPLQQALYLHKVT